MYLVYLNKYQKLSLISLMTIHNGIIWDDCTDAVGR